MNYVNPKDAINTVIDKYPDTLDFFINQGFEQFKNKAMLKTLGKIAIETALKSKGINLELFLENLNEFIAQSRDSEDVTLNQTKDNHEIKVEGLLPCPVRIPLLDQVKGYQAETGAEFSYDLKAASSGLDWLKEKVKSEENTENLSDLFISAGFDLFFDKSLMGKFKDQKAFKDYTGFKKYNEDFENDEINLRDPKGDYSMLAVVPAVFLVNQNELNGRKFPKTWEDLLSPEFERSISLPVSDFDLFNAIMLNIYKRFGEEGVRKLGKSLTQNLHPAQMVKSDRMKINKPTVTIMPYFFTKMTKPGGELVPQWPEDGAIISPIFMLTKTDKEKELRDITDLFASEKVGEILSHQGLFPSVHPAIDNRIPKEQKYMWLGWDYIYGNDIEALIETCERVFNEGVEEA